MLEFGMDANLTPAQILGMAEIETHKGPARRPYEAGMPLLWEQLLKELPNRMYEFHKCHMQMAGGVGDGTSRS